MADQAHLVELDAPAPLARVADGVLFLGGEAWSFGRRRIDHLAGAAAKGDGAILAPMPGRVLAVAVEIGQAVVKGQRLVVIEAMKMEQTLATPYDGVVAELNATEGDQVSEGALLVRVEETHPHRNEGTVE